MEIVDDMHKLIGNTPLLKINNFDIKSETSVFAKLENWNPGGSCKDRIGVYMIKKAEEDGLLKRGTTIIEATAGNTGIGIAFAALNKGYNIIFVVPNKFSIEKQIIMKAMGAKIINTPEELGVEGAVSRAEELLKEIPNSISLKQFENPANPLAHYETTGPEIYEALHGEISAFVCGAGSGGTFCGIAKYLKEKNPNIKCFLADPIGSILGGGTPGDYKIEGIGNHFIPHTLDTSLADDVIKVADDDAYSMVKQLAIKEGVLVGTSSGAAMFAALKLTEKINKGNIVTLFADRGDRYFSKNIFD